MLPEAVTEPNVTLELVATACPIEKVVPDKLTPVPAE